MADKILLVIKSPPYGAGSAAEGFRMATAMIAMDVLPQILFVDDGVYCLIKEQAPEAANLASFQERLKTLADLVGLHVLKESLNRRGLNQSDLNQNYRVKTLTLHEIAHIFSQNDVAITF